VAHARLALILRDEGSIDEANAAWSAALEAASCAADCPLDSPERQIVRAQWLAGTGDIDAALSTLAAAIDGPRWTASMLELPGLGSLRQDARWASLEDRLRHRIELARHEVASGP
jgi:hypothetical protein